MSSATFITDEAVISRIYLIRGKKVMLDRDLAEMYGVETSQLKGQVRRNISRFPEDFMFEMNNGELENWRCHFGISNEDKKGLKICAILFHRTRSGDVVKCIKQPGSLPGKYQHYQCIYSNAGDAANP